jgi:hypothetical protein
MRHKMLTQCAFFCIDVMTKRVMMSQYFVTCVVPPLALAQMAQMAAKLPSGIKFV